MKLSKDYCINQNANRIELYDTRWYEMDGLKVPSVTTILGAKAKPYALNKWLQQVGLNADKISQEAMDEGSNVHSMCEAYLKGQEIVWDDTIKFWEEWLPLQRFVAFCAEYKVEPLLIEQTLFSKLHSYAGTMDLFCEIEIKGKRQLALLDLKRSKQSNTAYEYQLASYLYAFNEMGLLGKIDAVVHKDINNIFVGLVLLNVESKKGYRLTEIENVKTKFDCFMAVKKIWEDENPNFDMTLKTYPLSVKSEEYEARYQELTGEEVEK